MRRILYIFAILVVIFTIPLRADWEWAKSAGGDISENCSSIVVDGAGNQYITGSFCSTVTFGSTTLTSSGDDDIFIAKLDINGNFLWAKKAGGSTDDLGYSITVDTAGNQYVTGYFNNTATFGSTILTSSGDNDIFIAKLDANGNFKWAKRAGGGSYDYCTSIAIDATENIYITGFIFGTAVFGNIALNSTGCEVFIAKLDANGNFIWAKKANGFNMQSYSIAVDAAGNQYVTGRFEGTSTFGSTALTTNGSFDIFIAKLDSNGNFIWAKNLGVNIGDFSVDNRSSIAIDAAGNQYVTGIFGGTLTFGSTTLTSNGSYDIFIAKLDANGNFIWAQKAGGDNDDYGRSIAVDAAGNQYVTGRFKNSSIFGSTTLSSISFCDIFIAKLDANGNFIWAKRAGGNDLGGDEGTSITVDTVGDQYTTGNFQGTIIFGDAALTSNDSWGYSDIFIAKHKLEPIWLCSTNNNEVLQQKTEQCLRWDTNIPRTLKLEYTSNNGMTWQTIAANVPSNQHSYPWTLPNITSNKCKVRISDMANSEIVDESDNTFTICDKGIIISPTSNQAYKIGSGQAVNWQTVNNITNLKFEYTITADLPTPSWQTMNGTLIGGIYIWNVPNTPSRNCKVKISNTQNPQEAFISETFTIYDLKVTSPNGGENWVINEQHNIAWTAAALNDLKIEYSANNGQNWNLITASTPSSSSLYNWTIPNTISNNCVIRIYDSSNPTISDESDNRFKITDGVDIEDPIIPLETKLNNCYPNPFNNTTSINYDLANTGAVQLAVYNSKGELVKQLVNNQQNSGRYSISFDAANFNSGVYFYKLEADGKSFINKMLLVK